MQAGTIELSGKVVVSDPCYSRDVWCMATGIDVKPGEYKTYIVKKDGKEFGDRVAVIMAVHIDYVDSINEADERLKRKSADETVYVCLKYYNNDPLPKPKRTRKPKARLTGEYYKPFSKQYRYIQ